MARRPWQARRRQCRCPRHAPHALRDPDSWALGEGSPEYFQSHLRQPRAPAGGPVRTRNADGSPRHRYPPHRHRSRERQSGTIHRLAGRDRTQPSGRALPRDYRPRRPSRSRHRGGSPTLRRSSKPSPELRPECSPRLLVSRHRTRHDPKGYSLAPERLQTIQRRVPKTLRSSKGMPPDSRRRA